MSLCWTNYSKCVSFLIQRRWEIQPVPSHSDMLLHNIHISLNSACSMVCVNMVTVKFKNQANLSTLSFVFKKMLFFHGSFHYVLFFFFPLKVKVSQILWRLFSFSSVPFGLPVQQPIIVIFLTLILFLIPTFFSSKQQSNKEIKLCNL